MIKEALIFCLVTLCSLEFIEETQAAAAAGHMLSLTSQLPLLAISLSFMRVKKGKNYERLKMMTIYSL